MTLLASHDACGVDRSKECSGTRVLCNNLADPMTADELIREFFAGSRRALSRVISMVEGETPEATAILRQFHARTGRAHVIGITGPAGAGKSSLTGRLAAAWRRQGKSIGIVAVDPTSPFTGGALLGDRIRMGDLALDPGVFVRSMGSRGSLGGLSRKTNDVVKVLDAFGMDIVLVETVGVGQSEVDIVRAADTTLVVLMPGMGDGVQALKAGILEIADIFVINKADRAGTAGLEAELGAMLALGCGRQWSPPIRRTIATAGDGVEAVIGTIDDHLAFLRTNGMIDQRRRARAREEIIMLLEEQIRRLVLKRLVAPDRLDHLADQAARHERNPYDIVAELIATLDIGRGNRPA